MKKLNETILFFALLLIFLSAVNSFARASELEVIDKNIYKSVAQSLNLSSKDIQLYKETFSAIRDCRWDKEEKRYKKINSDSLIGHTLAQKYLSKGYLASSEELEEWLSKYKDLPQYDRIKALSDSVEKSNISKEDLKFSQKIPESTYGYNWKHDKFPRKSKKDSDFLINHIKKFNKYINTRKSKAAKNILEDTKFRMNVPNKTWDAMAATLATLYFTDNYDELALEWSNKPSRRSKIPQAYWIGGLASWRLGNYKKAANMFEELYKLENQDEWMMSSGAYWAYRSYEKLNNEKKSIEALKNAAKYKRTFYGILANYKLNNETEYNWNYYSFSTDFSSSDYRELILTSPALKRAVILASINENKLAKQEIINAYRGLNNAQKEMAMFIAEQYGMHDLSMQIAKNLRNNKNDIYYDCISYPVPKWEQDIWNADKSLVLALIRRESSFKESAVSSKGAKGLMQIMPNTATYISEDNRLKYDNDGLFDPMYNIEIGQKYINYLKDKPYVKKNLIFLATAYNAGPQNLIKWKKRAKYNNDPLMFMEAIPSIETRIYIERVITNFWMYNHRFNKTTQTIELLANNQWPIIE